MEEERMKLFRITRNGATAYISHYSTGLPLYFENPENYTKEDAKLCRDLLDAELHIPGGVYEFYYGCSNVIMYNEEQARKFVDWLKGYWGEDIFEAEYICPFTNEEAWNDCPDYMRI